MSTVITGNEDGRFDHFRHPRFTCHIVEFVLAMVCFTMFLKSPATYEVRVDTKLKNPAKKDEISTLQFASAIEQSLFGTFRSEQSDVKTHEVKNLNTTQFTAINDDDPIIQLDDISRTQNTENTTIAAENYTAEGVNFENTTPLNIWIHTSNVSSVLKEDSPSDLQLAKKSRVVHLRHAHDETTPHSKETGGRQYGSLEIDVLHCTFLGFFVISAVIPFSYICQAPIWDITFIVIALPCAAMYLAAGEILLNGSNMPEKDKKKSSKQLRNMSIVGTLSTLCGLCFVVNFVIHVIKYAKEGKSDSPSTKEKTIEQMKKESQI